MIVNNINNNIIKYNITWKLNDATCLIYIISNARNISQISYFIYNFHLIKLVLQKLLSFHKNILFAVGGGGGVQWLYFPDSLVGRYGHVTACYSIECEWNFYVPFSCMAQKIFHENPSMIDHTANTVSLHW